MGKDRERIGGEGKDRGRWTDRSGRGGGSRGGEGKERGRREE